METIPSEENQIINIILIAIGLLVFMSFAIVLFFYFSRKKIVKTELEKANLVIANQKEVIQSTLVMQEAERKRIAQDMHDAISSKLNIVALNANFLTEHSISSSDANKFGNSILNITNTILESSRQIAHYLLPPTLDKFGLKAALEELCDEAEESGAFQITHNLDIVKGLLSEQEELHLFRITQELFSNTIKYSETTKIELLLENKENLVSLQYRDNGKGFDVSEAKKAKGIGLSGMENRASILNAKLTIKSSIGEGVSVLVLINKEDNYK